MIRRNLRILPTSILISLVALAPTIALLVMTHRHAVRRAQIALDDDARLGKRRIDELIAAADKKLALLIAETRNKTLQQQRELLDRVVYGDVRFRESGVIDSQGRLVLTDRGLVTPPIPLSPDARANPDAKGTEVVGRVRTVVVPDESIILARPTDGLGSVNLLVQPDVLTIYLDHLDLGETGFLAFVRASDSQFLAGVGAIPNEAGFVVLPELDQYRMRSEAISSDGRVRVIVESNTQWIMRFWWQELWIIGPIAVLCNALLIGIMIRYSQTQLGLDHDLKLGLKRKEFDIHYQPIVDITTGRWIGAEALMRWNHPVHGWVRPDVFIPLAEQTGQIVPLTRWLIERSGQQLAEVFRQHPNFYLSVNLPPKMLLTGEAAALLQNLPVGGSMTADRLVFEVTERQLLDGPTEEVAAEMDRLSRIGVRFALDDFGTGYSSLSYLHKFRFQLLKIDRSFLSGPGKGEATMKVLETLIDLGKKLDMTLVAEGVEVQQQADELQSLSVRYVQGWLYCRAIPATDFCAQYQSQS